MVCFFFKNINLAKDAIKKCWVTVNKCRVNVNYILSKGDIISFNYYKSDIIKKNKFKNIASNYFKNKLFFSFFEIDHFTKTIVIIKDLKELSLSDMRLLCDRFVDCSHKI